MYKNLQFMRNIYICGVNRICCNMTRDNDVFKRFKEALDRLEDQYGEKEMFNELEDVLDKLSEKQGQPLDQNPFEVGENGPFSMEDNPLFGGGGETGEDSGSPNVGLFKTIDRDSEIELVADLPGYAEENISLTLTNDERVRISAEATSDMYRESVSHVYNLPEPVQGDEAEAELQNGVLTVTLPKREPDDQTTISID